MKTVQIPHRGQLESWWCVQLQFTEDAISLGTHKHTYYIIHIHIHNIFSYESSSKEKAKGSTVANSMILLNDVLTANVIGKNAGVVVIISSVILSPVADNHNILYIIKISFRFLKALGLSYYSQYSFLQHCTGSLYFTHRKMFAKQQISDDLKGIITFPYTQVCENFDSCTLSFVYIIRCANSSRNFEGLI